MAWLTGLQHQTLVQKSAISNQQSAISNQQSGIAQNTPEAGAEWQKVALKPKAETLSPSKPVPKVFVFVDGRYVKIVSDEVDPAAPRPSFHYEPKDASNSVHVKAAKEGQKNLDDFNSGLNWGVGKQLYDFTIGAGIKTAGFVWHHSYGKIWNYKTGNTIEIKKKDAEIAKINQDIRQIPSLMANAFAYIAANPQEAASQALKAPLAHAESLIAQGKCKEAGEFWGRALASVPLAVYSGIGSVAAIRNLPKLAKAGGKLVKKTKIGVLRLPKGIGKEGGRLPKGNVPIVGRVVASINADRAMVGKLPLFINWRKLDLFDRKSLLREALKTQNYSETEIHILAKMDNLSSNDVHRLVKYPAAGSKPYVPSEHDYVGLVDSMTINISPEAAAHMGTETAQAAINTMKYNMLILLRNTATKSDLQVVLRKKIPVSIVKLEKPPGRGWVNSTEQSLGYTSEVYFDSKYFSFSSEQVNNQSMLSCMSHEFLHAIMYNPKVLKKIKFDFSRSRFVQNYAPSFSKPLEFQKQAYVKEYIKRRILDEVYAVRKEALIAKNQGFPRSRSYNFDLNGKHKGPISNQEAEVIIQKFKIDNASFYEGILKCAETNYNFYYPSQRVHN